MRKIQLSIYAASAMALLLSGCSNNRINLKAESFELQVGVEVSTELSEYVRASETILEQMELDVSQVNYNSIGTYRASVTYNDNMKEFNIVIADKESPIITMKSNNIYIENSGSLGVFDVVTTIEDYSDVTYGFSDDLTKSDSTKQMLDTLSFSGLGDYNCEVIARDEYGNCAVQAFTVHIVEEGNIPIGETEITDFAPYMNTEIPTINAVSTYSSEGVFYGVGNSVDPETNRPYVDYYVNMYDKFAVDFIQPESDFVWLTFNEITERGYTEQILDTLLEKEVSAVFFVTLSYVENNPELIQRMIDEGHVLGNYTADAVNTPELSENELTSEIEKLYNYVYQTYGYKMYLFRPPSGYYSEQTLATAQTLGYRTVLWSFAYADWDVNNQPGVSAALSNALDKVHGGAIYLLSGASSTNAKMLSDMIDGIREKDYEFAVYQQN